MKHWLLGCTAMLVCCIGAAAEDVNFGKFDSQTVPSYWKLRNVKGEVLPEKNAIRLTYPKWKEGMDLWPAVVRDFPDDANQTIDWSNHRFLAFDLYYQGTQNSVIKLRLDDKQKHIRQLDLPVKANGQQTVVAINLSNLANDLNLKEMVHFDLFLEKPAADFVVDLSNLRLTDQPYSEEYVVTLVERTIPKYVTAIDALNAAADLPIRKPLLDDAQKQLAILKSNASLAEKLAVCQNGWLAQYPAELKRIEFFAKFADRPFHLMPIPTTLNLRIDQLPAVEYGTDLLKMDAARGEAESLQLLVTCGATKLENVTYSATDFEDAKGNAIKPELSVVGYIPVAHPTPKPNGFGVAGLYPDVLLPKQTFDVEPYKNQALWLSVWVPEDAVPGTYKSVIRIKTAAGQAVTAVAILQVYPVIVPKLGKLKTCWVSQPANTDKWNKGAYDDFLKLNLKYRFSMDTLVSSDCLPWNKVFTVGEDGKVTADWTEFDKRMEYWRSLGKNTFTFYSPRWFAYEPIEKQVGNLDAEKQKLQLAAKHLKEKGWIEDFYCYVFDEPHPSLTEATQNICKFFQDAIGHDAHLILTACHGNIPAYAGFVNIFVPHINLFDPAYMHERQTKGDHVWMYTCIGTVGTRYPDTWKLDFYGTGHRAVGWWLFKYDVEGYLYWGVNYWQENPWKDAMTFPNGNGDGSMFYPDPERKGLPWPSVRAEIVRDGFEDYELLHLLRAKYAGKADADVEKLLSCNDIIYATNSYNETGDLDYINLHRRLLELLSK